MLTLLRNTLAFQIFLSQNLGQFLLRIAEQPSNKNQFQYYNSCWSGDVWKHLDGDFIERWERDTAAPDQEHASGQEGDSQAHLSLGGALQRRKHRPSKLHTAPARSSTTRLPEMQRKWPPHVKYVRTSQSDKVNARKYDDTDYQLRFVLCVSLFEIFLGICATTYWNHHHLWPIPDPVPSWLVEGSRLSSETPICNEKELTKPVFFIDWFFGG